MQSSVVMPRAMKLNAARPAGRAFTPVQAAAKSSRQKTEDRHKRLRKKLSGDAERPRLAVFRSNEHIYAQVIDDVKGHTLASASTLLKDVKAAIEGNGANTAAAAAVGKKIAEAAKAAGVTKVAFDRGGFAYHGRIQALADAAREGGLEF